MEIQDLTQERIAFNQCIESDEEVRHNPRLFFTVPGHEEIAVHAGAGAVVGKGDAYVLVEKIGVAGEIAEQDYRDLNETG